MTPKTDAPTQPTTPKRARAPKEAVLAAAVDVARAAVEDHVTADLVGEHEGVQVEGERLLTHYFASLQPGYRGWHWAVTLARPPRGRTATVCEVALVPGEGALVAPAWVPWEQRLEPSDVSGTDVLPYDAADVRLVAGRTDTTEDADRLEIDELGLGRARVLSREGIDRALTRWYEGAGGPTAPAAIAAQAHCGSCGFFVKLSGTPRRLFGVCANEWSADDGRVVSVDHGCGSHSETDVAPRSPLWNPPSTVLDEGELEIVARDTTVAREDDATPDAAPEGRRGRRGGRGRGAPADEAASGAVETGAATAAGEAAGVPAPEPWQSDEYVQRTGTVAIVAGVEVPGGGPGAAADASPEGAGDGAAAEGDGADADGSEPTQLSEPAGQDAEPAAKARRSGRGGRSGRTRKTAEPPAPDAAPEPWQSDEYVQRTGTTAVVTGSTGD